MNTKKKRQPIQFLLPPHQKAFLQKAADDAGTTMANWVRMVAIAAAEKQLGRVGVRNWKKGQAMTEWRAENGHMTPQEYEEWCIKQGPALMDSTHQAQIVSKLHD